ncbi:PrtD family type I secretion system ABC transporter [Brevundimonas alba]|uniref:PrtD family type I secretion system ABC transporter n=1 Tax=Brevundimonas alba TaxID=74314 RepID=A0A7X5YHT7_9CAUL|nr:PrtD family type I secretion system ABC transporter [Brevundimonas alba]
MAFAGGVNLLFLASPLFLLQIYNRVIPSGSIPTLIALSFALLIALVTMVVLDAIRARVLVRAAARLNRILAPRLFQAVVDSTLSKGPPLRNAQPIRDLDAFRGAMAGPAAQLFFDAPWSPLFLLVLFLLHPLIGLLGVLGAALLLSLAFINDALTREDAAEASAAAARSYAFADSVVRFADPIHAMGMEDALRSRWQIDRDDMMVKQSGGSDRAADLSAFIRFCRLVLQGCVLAVGALLVIRGSILPASIFAASLLLGRALSPLEQAVIGWRQMALALNAGRNVQRVLSAAPPPGRPTRVAPADASVTLERVTFVPGAANRPALRDISLTIASGETVGVVGASGAGKSCLARLIVAASLPTKGKVAIGGLPTSRWTAPALARQIGFLPQNVGLFPGTIRDNIGRFQECSDKSIIEAAKRAKVHDMILDLPDGYDTVVGEGGAGLSGGQRQRVALARALFGSPRLLVLDEPNAHLDAEGDEALEEALKALRRTGTTIVIVAHRLNPLAHVDRVLMLSKGELELDGPRRAVIEQVPTETVEHFAQPS